MDKDTLRKKYLRIRSSITDRTHKNESIAQKIFSLKEFSQAQVIVTYINTEFESATKEIIEKAISLNKKVFIPYLKDNAVGSFEGWDSLTVFTIKGVDYFEPLKKTSRELAYDLVLVPGVVFDKSGNRIGMGSGWYDKFLSNIKVKTKIGLCYDEQIIEGSIQYDKFDVKMDLLVTPSRTYKFS